MAKREAPNKEDSIQTDVENMNWKVEHVTSDLLCVKSLDYDRSTLTIQGHYEVMPTLTNLKWRSKCNWQILTGCYSNLLPYQTEIKYISVVKDGTIVFVLVQFETEK